MKRKLVIVGLLIFALVNAVFAQNDWENEKVFERNKLGARVPSYSFKSEEDAIIGNRENARMVSLNGVWKFKFVEDDDQRPTDFMAKDFSGQGWNDIEVVITSYSIHYTKLYD